MIWGILCVRFFFLCVWLEFYTQILIPPVTGFVTTGKWLNFSEL